MAGEQYVRAASRIDCVEAPVTDAGKARDFFRAFLAAGVFISSTRQVPSMQPGRLLVGWQLETQ